MPYPRKRKADKLSEPISGSLTPGELRALRRVARKQGVPMAELIREGVLKVIEEREERPLRPERKR
jgi:hypothetical protein